MTPAVRLTARGVLGSEWIKLWSLRSLWLTASASVFVTIGLGLIAAFAYDPGPHPEDALSLALSGVTFAALVAGALGVLVAAGEYTTGMVRSTLTAVPARLPVLWSKSLVAGGTAALATTAGALVAFLGGGPLLRDGVTRFGLFDEGVLRALAGAGLFLGLVAVSGVALGVLVRSSAGGIVLVAGVLLILPGLVLLLPGAWSDAVTPYLPGSAGAALMARQPADGGLGPGAGLAVLTGYVAVVLAAAAYRLAKTDA